MKNDIWLGVGVGAFLGFIVSLLLRPSLPLVGQPPIGIAIGTLLGPQDRLDRMYASEFLPTILVCLIGGSVVGLAFAKIIELLKIQNINEFESNALAKTLENGGYTEQAPEPAPPPPPRAERPAPPPVAPRAVPVDRTQAIAPPARPTPPSEPAPAARAYQPAQPERPRQVARSSAPKQTSAGAVQGKIRNSVYRQNPDGSCTIVKGKHVGKTFRTFEEMRRTLR